MSFFAPTEKEFCHIFNTNVFLVLKLVRPHRVDQHPSRPSGSAEGDNLPQGDGLYDSPFPPAGFGFTYFGDFSS